MIKLELILSPKQLEKAHTAHFNNAIDLLKSFPIRYENVQLTDPMGWMVNDKVWVEGEVIECVNQRIRSKLVKTQFLLQSKDQLFNVSIFNRPWLKVGMHIVCFAKVEANHKLTALSYNTKPIEQQYGLNPIYSNTKILSSSDLKGLIDRVLPYLKELDIQDVPTLFQTTYKLVRIKQALYWMHKAKREEELKLALRTLKYEEFLRFQTKLYLGKKENSGIDFGKIKVFDRRHIQAWKSQLPFELSSQQTEVLDEILDDLQSSKRMYRLLQGDVGSGKTVIASLALYASSLANYQSAFLVPTEILAYQHYKSLQNYLPSSVRLEVLTSSKTKKEKQIILDRLIMGEIDCLIGTHSLIQDDVKFKNVGLVIADEQHRFGVKQRRLLSEKGKQVDFLLMSATPIPRTLASVVFGDLDVSSISTYHTSKQKVHTQFIRDNSIKPILKTILNKVAQGQQVYIVCPAIIDNEEKTMKSVESIASALTKVLPEQYRIASMHSKLKTEEKDRIMNDFVHHKIDFLISTTVIEVGVNVSNANVIVIYDADHFGLSQLHQLRGRVGRGEDEGYCYLLSDTEDPLSLERLDVLVDSSDGFYIANKDLELRGPGELFGLKQSGVPSFLVANVILDQAILLKAQEDAQNIVEHIHEIEFQDWVDSCMKELKLESLD